MNHRLEHVLTTFEQTLPQHYSSDEIRKTQVELALNIAGILAPPQRIKVLMANAPVGTGKTFGALIPSVYDTYNHRSRLIYSTSSLNLQAQLKNEELNYLQIKGEVESFVVAKGVTHYICLRRIDDGRISDKIKRDLMDYSTGSDEGDRVGFEKTYYPLIDDVWKQVNLKANKDCNYCDKRLMCPTAIHRAKFNDPRINVVVTNHNQLIQSVLNLQNEQAPILDYRNPGGVIIVDEAHDFEDAILSQLSEDLSVTKLQSVVRQLKDGVSKEKAFSRFYVIEKEAKNIRNRLETSRGRHTVPQNCLLALQELMDMLNIAITVHEASKMDTQSLIRRHEEESALESCAELIKKILDVQNYTHWFNFDEEETSITVVNSRFRKYSQTIIRDLCINNRVVFMSGTLAVDDSFSHVYYNWGGQPPQSQELILGTVFDYSKQAIAYVPEHVKKPIPSQSSDFYAYCTSLSEEIFELIKIAGGRTLVLTTSHKQMGLLYELLKPSLDEMGIDFLKQGDKSIELLTEDFKRDETSVLIGTGSFFAGLSVPRKALVSVILCRLPFPPGNDPFLDLIAEDLSNAEKMEYIDFPRMMIRLLQAGGRLIRTIEDFGCFTILDPRVFDSSYSEKVLSELNKVGYTITRNRTDVETFIQDKMHTSGIASYPEYNQGLLKIPDVLKADDSPRMIRQTVSNDIYRSPLENVISPDQQRFYNNVREMAGMKPGLHKGVKRPQEVYAYLVKINENKKLGLDLPSTFPFASGRQKKEILEKIKMKQMEEGSTTTTYKLSPEELEKYRNLPTPKISKWKRF